ncbi:toll/interleukin-1 receptor domain-containing protein [Frankia sp. Cj5]|uniref:toll/interleukin-1 receptor domain-containing protein n=1 Tax=Frankia sp. Cj5 TaxID=2880978 RepID=UPI001EF4AF3A|nr:toll/interleukin-1 receptor domain-containing protein [Frankia sp. Cj5]
MGHGDAADGWDFFVSYTQADRGWAEWIAWVLEEDGFRVLVQAWDFGTGSNWVRGMDDGVSRSRRTVAVLSRAYAQSRYCRAEWQAAWEKDPDGTDRKLVPFRVEDCPRPGLLAQVVSGDLFGLAESDAQGVVVGAARSAAGQGGRGGKPAVRPSFLPGGRGCRGGWHSPGRRVRAPPGCGPRWMCCRGCRGGSWRGS